MFRNCDECQKSSYRHSEDDNKCCWCDINKISNRIDKISNDQQKIRNDQQKIRNDQQKISNDLEKLREVSKKDRMNYCNGCKQYNIRYFRRRKCRTCKKYQEDMKEFMDKRNTIKETNTYFLHEHIVNKIISYACRHPICDIIEDMDILDSDEEDFY